MIPDPFLHDQHDPDALREGYYLIKRWRSGRVSLPVRIWFGAPVDPETGELLDRAPRWQLTIGGVAVVDDTPLIIGGASFATLSDFWPACASDPIEAADHDYMVARAEWAAAYDPADPFGSSSGRIDPMTATLPFMEAS